ncbi:MAG: hypothetical protein HZB53_21725 [Chloroflexi bacterium]|nr:hypothetical protein [Chloroflexota bacterium]
MSSTHANSQPQRPDSAAGPRQSAPGDALNLSAGADLGPQAPDQLDPFFRQSAVLAWQQTHGNAFVQRMLAEQAATPVVQRQTPVPAPAPGATPVPAPGTGNAPPVPLPTFHGTFLRSGPNFDAKYTPTAPAPAIDPFVVTHNVFIDFKPFDEVRKEEPYKSMRFTKEQKADFQWSKAEETKFAADFISSVHDGWSGKHKLHLKDPSFSEYIANVQVKVEQVKDAAKAHTKIKAMKIPKGAPRYRSFVDGHDATLDIRDASEAEKHKVRDRKLVRQVKPFANNSADTAPVDGQLTGIADEIKKMMPSGADPKAPLGADWDISFLGRTNKPGTVGHNKKLGEQRADATKKRVGELVGWGNIGNSGSVGSENASDSEDFRRVDVNVFNKSTRDVEQNVAAHEFGHMIGLDDEYLEEKPGKDGAPKFFGDQSEHYEKIKQLMGEDAAKETLRENSASIMSTGGEVKRGHYVFFLEAINSMTSKSWSVE